MKKHTNKNSSNESGSELVIEQDLLDTNKLHLNGHDKEETSAQNANSDDHGKVWRRLTITLTIIATSITMTFSWQKKSKPVQDKISNPVEVVSQTNLASDTLTRK